ncbi:MAG: 16S rRNA (guanine(527)-N(7))-methyltransferase RsmG [Candidatus Nanopelagicales bacterium]
MQGSVPRGTSSKKALEENLEKLKAYEALLKQHGEEKGLLGPKDIQIIWERHILNSLPLMELISPNSTLADIGSGAGLPGIPLSICRPDLKITLIEPMARRAEFLKIVIKELEIQNTEVFHGRAEALFKKQKFDFVTARAVAPFKKLVKIALPLLKSDGYLLALKGAKANLELNDALEVINELQATSLGVVKTGSEIQSEVSIVVVRRNQ